MLSAVRYNFVIYLFVILLEINVQSVDHPPFALRGYLIELSPPGNFTDWLRILGNTEPNEDYYDEIIEDEEDSDICDYIKDLFQKIGNNIFIVTCEQKPAIHELHPDESISVIIHLDEEIWNALTHKCLQSPEDLLAREINVNSDGKNELQVSEFSDLDKAYAYDMNFELKEWRTCNRTLKDIVDEEFRQGWLPQMEAELLYSKVRCQENDYPDHIRFRQFYDRPNVDDQLRELESRSDDWIKQLWSSSHIYPQHHTLDDDHANLCGGNYKSETSSTISSTVSTIWSVKYSKKSVVTSTTAHIPKILKSSQSIRMVFSEASYVLVMVLIYMMQMV